MGGWYRGGHGDALRTDVEEEQLDDAERGEGGAEHQVAAVRQRAPEGPGRRRGDGKAVDHASKLTPAPRRAHPSQGGRGSTAGWNARRAGGTRESGSGTGGSGTVMLSPR